MDIATLLGPETFPAGRLLWSPAVFALLLGVAVAFVWAAFAPSTPARQVTERLDGYLERTDIDPEMTRSFAGRAVLPLFRRFLRFLGRLTPKRNVEKTRQMLVQAGEPGGLTAIDFFGVRLLAGLACAVGVFYIVDRARGFPQALPLAVIAAVLGYLLPQFWLGSRARGRSHKVRRALPDALDMLTVGVEAGLGFESAMLRVGEKWDNALTREFRRAVGEMRVGTARDAALQRMAARTRVEELNTLVAVLVQSTQLGVPVAQVLHQQAFEIRLKRRQRVEELARQAGVKMVFPLAICILPSLFIVGIGPAVARIIALFANIHIGGSPLP